MAKKAVMPRMTAEDKKWRTEEDLRTLRRAEEIKKDKSRVKDVKVLVKEEMKALSKIKVTKK